jgi:hypothetical protein
MELDLTVKDGVQRAHATTATTLRGGRIDRDDSSVTFSSDSLITTVACLPGRKAKTQVIVIAAGHDGRNTLGVMEQLRDGVRRGGPYE